ncbi:MAG: protein kinase [Clostridiales bacterium]|nr:protein kinase [Clostridiales bacterium]
MLDKSIYKELYHYDDKHSLVMNEITHDVCFMKTLVHYDISVYQYIKDNPNKFIPRIFDIFEENNTLYVVEEYIQGSSFDSVIYGGRVTDQVKLNYFINLCYGIKYLHDAPNHIIHRDIKLSNIIIAEDGDLKIIDYDAAKVYKPGAKRDTVLIGTEGMAAPEQYGFRQSDERTDIYAIGMLLKEAFPGNKRLQAIADKASAFEPNDRYQNISELINDLKSGRWPKTEKKKKGFWPMPGFRSGKTYKKVISITFWVIMSLLSTVFNLYRGDGIYSFVVYAVFVMSSAFLVVDLVFDWTGGKFITAPGTDSDGPAKYILRILYAFVIVFIMFILLGLVITFPGIIKQALQ